MEKRIVQCEECTVKCSCNAILFNLSIVDAFIKYKKQKFILFQELKFPNTLSLNNEPQYKQDWSLYTKKIICQACKNNIGFYFYTVNVELKSLLHRTIIKMQQLQILKDNQNFTVKFKQIFQQQFQYEQEQSQQVKGQNNSKIQQLKRSIQDFDYIEGSQMIKEIIKSLSFFANGLSKIDKRVREVENVSQILKKKIQKLTPNLTKQK